MMPLKTLYHVFREVTEVNRKLHDIEEFSRDDNSIDTYKDEIHKLNWLCGQLEPLCEGVEPVNLRWKDGEFVWDEHLDVFEKQERS